VNLIQKLLADATRFHDVRLLAQILRDQFAGAIQRLLAIAIHRGDNQLRPVDVLDPAPPHLQTLLKLGQSALVVLRRHEVVEQNTIRDLAGQGHHIRPGRSNVDRHVAWLPPAMHHIQLHTMHLHKLALIRDVLHGEQIAHHLNGFAHGFERLLAVYPDIPGQRIPPGANPQDDPVRRQVVQCQEGRGDQRRVACPVVDHAGADLDAPGRRRVSRHRNNGIAHQAAFGLPDSLEPAILGVLHVLDRVRQRVRILQIQSYSVSHKPSPVYSMPLRTDFTTSHGVPPDNGAPTGPIRSMIGSPNAFANST